jgi:prepilin-type N-terminal cleavage/methylation domain-containing protein
VRRGERGFTLIEVLVALVITVIGLAGVLMMQASATRSNRQNLEFSRASMIAEEAIEIARGTAIDTLTGGMTLQPQTYSGVLYTISLTATELASNSNLVIITAAVTYSEDGDTSTVDDRTARFQLIRTRTEML